MCSSLQRQLERFPSPDVARECACCMALMQFMSPVYVLISQKDRLIGGIAAMWRQGFAGCTIVLLTRSFLSFLLLISCFCFTHAFHSFIAFSNSRVCFTHSFHFRHSHWSLFSCSRSSFLLTSCIMFFTFIFLFPTRFFIATLSHISKRSPCNAARTYAREMNA